MSKRILPPRDILSDENVLFFYRKFLCGKVKATKEEVEKTCKKNGIQIVFAGSKSKDDAKEVLQKATSLYPNEKNTIKIFKKKLRGRYLFSTHIRNAFAHQQIRIENGILYMFDWNLYNKNGKKHSFAYKHITMHGCVDYPLFQKIINELIEKE